MIFEAAEGDGCRTRATSISKSLTQAGIHVRCASQKTQRLVGSRKDVGGEPSRRNCALAAKPLQSHYLGEHVFCTCRRIIEGQEIAASVHPTIFHADHAMEQPSLPMFTKRQVP